MSNVNWGKLYNCFKVKCIQFFGGLVMDKTEDGKYVASMGRISWWITFAPAVYIWVSGHGLLEEGTATKDISPNHLNVLMMLAAYNFGKKAVETINNVWGNKVSPKPIKPAPKDDGEGPG